MTPDQIVAADREAIIRRLTVRLARAEYMLVQYAAGDVETFEVELQKWFDEKEPK